MPIVPMFHANAWAISFVGPMCGAKLVMPGAKLDGPSVYELLETRRSPSLPPCRRCGWGSWLPARKQSEADDAEARCHRRLGCARSGAARVRGRLRRRGAARLGHDRDEPDGHVGKLLPEHAAMDHEAQIKTKLKQGRPPFTVEMKIVDDEGAEKPHDGKAFGRLLVRGPSIARAYFKNAGAKNERASAWRPAASSIPAMSPPSIRLASCRSPTAPRT
jgi:acyl-CoA synthetase (AMP-forming)/AMP-acid ligase II